MTRLTRWVLGHKLIVMVFWLLALVVLPVSFLRGTGLAGMFVPLVSVAVAVTLLPVILATAGARLDWPRLRKEGSASRPWTAWARLVHRRKRAAALAGGGVLALLMGSRRHPHPDAGAGPRGRPRRGRGGRGGPPSAGCRRGRGPR